MLAGVLKVAPPSVLFAKIIWYLPVVFACQTTYTSFPDTANCGELEDPIFLLISTGTPKVMPPSVLFATSIPYSPVELSFHTMNTLFPDTAICGKIESPLLPLMFIGVPNPDETASTDLKLMDKTKSAKMINRPST